MKYIKHFMLLLFSLFFLISGCQKSHDKASNPDFDIYLDNLWKTMATQDGFTLHSSFADPVAFGLDTELVQESRCILPLQSKIHFQERFQNLKEETKQLSSFKDTRLTASQIHTKHVLLSSMEKELALEPYLLYPNPMAASGVGNLARSFYLYDFVTKEDVETYFTLLSQVDQLYQAALKLEKERRNHHIYLNKAQLQAALRNVDKILSTSLEDNIFIKDFNEKIETMKELSRKEKDAYQEKNKLLVESILFPTCRQWRQSLSVIPTASEEAERLCDYPQGQDYYTKLMQYYVGCDLTPEEAIVLFQTQIDSSRNIIQKHYANNPDLYSAYQLAVPELTDSREILKELTYDSLIEFPETNTVNYTLQEMPDTLSLGSSVAFYQLPVIDHEHTNRLYVNSSELKSLSLFPTLAHEAFPGHMYQVNYALSKNWNPVRYMNTNAGYDEGWGFYAQIYSYQFMQFSYNEEKENKALQEIFAQKDLLNTSLLCLSDLYVNYKGYDQNQLAKELKQYGVEKKQAGNVYQTVLASPTAYLPYGLGYLELQNLAKELKEKLGKQFELKSFHKAVLDAGSCTFPVLKEFVTNQIQ